MWRGFTRAVRAAVAVFAIGFSGLTGCTGSGERLPSCKGKPVPINTDANAVLSVAPSRHTDAH